MSDQRLHLGWIPLALGLFCCVAVVGAEREVEGTDPVLAEVSEAADSTLTNKAALQEPELDLNGRSTGQIFLQANEFYNRGEYTQASKLYSHLIARGLDSGRVHFNLGNAQLRNGELGRAIASYRRSRLILPRDEDVAANLAFARSSAKDAIAPPEPSKILSTLFFWHFGLSPSELAGIALIVNLTFWGLCILLLTHRKSEVVRWCLILSLVVLVALLGSLAAGFLRPTTVAVIVPQEISAHTGPEAEAVIRFKLHAGTEVRVRDERDGWLRVALPDGQQGWIERELAEVIEGPW